MSLEAEIAVYMARLPAHANIGPAKPPKDAGMVYYEVVVSESIPIHIATVVGDVIHNLRTSLDLLASDLVTSSGGNSKRAYFPFSKDAASLEDVIIQCQIKRAGPMVVDLVRELMPFKGGNEILRGIHDLDIMDKHRMLLPTHGRINVPYSDGEPVIPSSGIQFDRSDRLGRLRTGILTSGHIRTSNWPQGEKLPVTFDLTFPQEVPFAAQPLVPSCREFLRECSSVIDRFEALVHGAVTREFPW